MTLLYDQLASWWPLLSAPEEYAEEAEFYRRVLTEAAEPPPVSVLELGCGGGNNASHMKQHFRMTLTDVSTQMLEVSRAQNPECEHVQGDMSMLRLGRAFDAVFVHDAVSYMTTGADLRAAIETAFVHLRPGGAALFHPDNTAETFSPSTECGGHDGAGRALRYLLWRWDPDPSDTMYVDDFTYSLRHEDGSVTVEHDRHIAGMLPAATWIGALEEVGFEAVIVPFEHSEVENGTPVFLGTSPR